MSHDLAQYLLGTWTTDPEDRAAIEAFGSVTMLFRADGTLVYTIEEGLGVQAISLTWRLEHGELVTDQPSLPREERSEVSMSQDGRLLLTYGGQLSCYVRKGPLPDID